MHPAETRRPSPPLKPLEPILGPDGICFGRFLVCCIAGSYETCLVLVGLGFSLELNSRDPQLSAERFFEDILKTGNCLQLRFTRFLSVIRAFWLFNPPQTDCVPLPVKKQTSCDDGGRATCFCFPKKKRKWWLQVGLFKHAASCFIVESCCLLDLQAKSLCEKSFHGFLRR